jgi:hypothetical protein
MLRSFADNSIAHAMGVPAEIHQEDFLYHFLEQHPSLKDNPQKHYFESARESAERVRSMILGNVIPHGISTICLDDFTLLDFASGFGMVNRHFRVVMPTASVEACDIHPAAAKFSKNYLGIPCHISSPDPSEVSVKSRYDVVLALSFLSHLPHHTWHQWLKLLCSLVNEGGLLIFTTHGPSSGISLSEKLLEKGVDFYFYPESEQLDLNTSSYGSSYAHPRYAMGAFDLIPDMHLSEFKMGAWWGGNQDVYILCKKSKSRQMVCRTERT